MTKGSMTIGELVGKILGEGNGDMMRRIVEQMLTAIMDVEVSQVTGAAHGERSDDRQTHRNGYRARPFDTRVGSINVAIPKVRQGTYFPSFLEPRRRSEEALLAVIQEAYVHGVSTRKVEDLVQALGVSGVSKSEVSRICSVLDEGVTALRTAPLTKAYPYLWLDATYHKVREGNRVVSLATIVAYALNEEGYREVIGLSVGASEDAAFWTSFLRELVERGLHGVQLVISDAHRGLKRAIASVFAGAAWQRCTVHFMRNVHAAVSRADQGMVTAAVRTIFNSHDYASGKEHLRQVADKLQRTHPKVAAMLEEAEEDLLAYLTFPSAHWRQIRSTNLLERLNREIKRRSDVVGIYPNRDAVLRLVGSLLIEQNEEWLVGKRYMSLESLSHLLPAAPVEAAAPVPELAAALAA